VPKVVDDDEVVFNAHHISFENDSDGDIKYHAKGVDRKYRTPITGKCCKIADGYLLGALIISNISILKQIRTMIGISDWASKERYYECIDMLGKSITVDHPVFKMPYSKVNSASESLICCFCMSKEKWNERIFSMNIPIKTFKNIIDEEKTERDLCWTVSIKLNSNAYLILLVRRLSMTPVDQFRWITPRSMEVVGNRIIIKNIQHLSQ
jgi:hypothetical protein